MMSKPFSNNVVIVSTCHIDWGGSEELWGKTAPILMEKGFQVIVYKSKINRAHPEFETLARKGVVLADWYSTFSLSKRIFKKMIRASHTIYKRLVLDETRKDHTDEAFLKTLRKYKPRLVVIAQGINFDGLHHGYQCLSENIPYVIICQKAVDFYWPPRAERPFMVKALQQARKCFFVSHHNHRLTEEQFGIRLANSEIIYNPVKISNKIPYPSTSTGFKMACVARLFLLDKGQDILLRILSQKKWKERPLQVSFIGNGDDYDGLLAMAKLLHISNVEFAGQLHDMEKVWQQHHALILPSRSEGLPLSLVEAMAAGRPVIVTDAGGNAELVEEGMTGFIGHINETSLDDAMERAWNNREYWEAMGQKASEHIANMVPKYPENDFANYLNEIIYEQ
jgi:glycosyltransferase involved in cell wall biosynthesis